MPTGRFYSYLPHCAYQHIGFWYSLKLYACRTRLCVKINSETVMLMLFCDFNDIQLNNTIFLHLKLNYNLSIPSILRRGCDRPVVQATSHHCSS